jgi:hypothetical protein
MAESGRNAEYAAGLTFGDSIPTQTPAMPIDGGNIFKQSRDAAKGGKDKGYPMPDIKSSPSVASISRGAEFTRANTANAPKVTTPSPVTKTITPTFQSINRGPGNGIGMPRGGFGLYSAGNPFGQML